MFVRDVGSLLIIRLFNSTVSDAQVWSTQCQMKFEDNHVKREKLVVDFGT
jgi:hypothetical protein